MRFFQTCLVLFCFGMPLCCLAQYSQGKQLKIGFGMHAISYRGDLSDPNIPIQRYYPGANMSIQLEGPKRLKLQLNTGFGKFAEQYDDVIPSTNPEVRPNTFVETSFYYSDLRLKYRFAIKPWFQPYLTAGAGILVFSPKDENGRFLQDALFTREQGEDYSTAIPQIPFGLGVQSRINRTISFSLAYVYRLTPSDYLDNIGNLGTRPGNDALHGLQLSMYITLSPPEGPVSDMPFAEERSLKESVSPDTTSQIQTQTPDPSSPSLSLTETELTIEMAAIERGDYIFYKIRKKDTISSLAEKFRVRPESIINVNFLKDQELKKGTTIRIPNTQTSDQ